MDSVFTPKYTLTEICESGKNVIVTLSITSSRFRFLENNPFVCKHRISFSGNKICKMEMVEYIGVDLNVWEKQRQVLIDWADQNQPELSGFIFDMTKTGAENYAKAIKMYREELNE